PAAGGSTNPSWPADSFDQTAVGALPAGWAQWTSTTPNAFAVSAAQFVSSPNSLAATAAASNIAARAWNTTPLPADAQATAGVFVNNLIPAQLFVRGQQLNTAAPSYYAVSIWRG